MNVLDPIISSYHPTHNTFNKMFKNILNVSFIFSSCLVHSPLTQKATSVFRVLTPSNRGVIFDQRNVDGRASIWLVLWMGRPPVLRGKEGRNRGGDQEGQNVGGDQAAAGNHDGGADEV